MTCRTCGRPGDGEVCSSCLSLADNPTLNPYSGLSAQPAQGQAPDPYLMGQDWTPPPDEPGSGGPPRRRGRVALIVGLCAVVAVGAVVATLFLTGEGPTAAVPQAATPQPSVQMTVAPEPEPTTVEPTQPATVFVTLTPSPAPEEPAQAEPPTTAPDSIETLTTDDAASFMNDYLRRVVADPDDGWGLLSTRRQQVENRESYYEYWPSLSSASVSGCVYEQSGSLDCQVNTVDKSGKAGTSQARFWLTSENGQIRIDVAGGGGAEQLAAEEELDRLRLESIAGLVHDDRWVAELSAKRPGISDPLQTAANGTHVFYLTDILAQHQALQSRLPEAHLLMLRREDWGKQGRDLWHTVADPGGLTSAADVEAWCAAAFPELSGKELANQCTPRQMTAPHG